MTATRSQRVAVYSKKKGRVFFEHEYCITDLPKMQV